LKYFITGTAGFIGFHLAKLLLKEGHTVFGYDGLTDYYDVDLKKRRHSTLLQSPNFNCSIGQLEDFNFLEKAIIDFEPDVIVHLAAQAGVRYSLENPKAYIDSNIVGTFNVMELAKKAGVSHLMMASTSSVYGANEEMPFSEAQKADTPLTIYAATKKATESLGHAHSHLWNIPTTMFRFFTVYGPFGRPDLALFKFVDAILDGREIDVYNQGEMYRDFTYVEDLVRAIYLLSTKIPQGPAERKKELVQNDNLSPVAPYRVVNIGNSQKVKLLTFIEAIEKTLGIKARKNLMDMQKGDVPATWADADLLFNLTGYKPTTNVEDGIKEFVNWFRDYYKK